MKPKQVKSYSFAEVLEEATRKADAYEAELAKLSPTERLKKEKKDADDLQATLDAYYKAGGKHLIHLKL